MDGSEAVGVGSSGWPHSRVAGGCVQQIRGLHRFILPDPDPTTDTLRGDPGEHPMARDSSRGQTEDITIHFENHWETS